MPRVQVEASRWFLALALASLTALALLLQPADQSLAVGILDQSQTVQNNQTSTFNPGQLVGQSFTAGVTGSLDQVAIAAAYAGPPSGSFTVQIRTVDGSGLPTSTVLGSGTLPMASLATPCCVAPYTLVPVPLAAPAAVAAGTRYAIVVFGDSRFSIGGAGLNPYAGGVFLDDDGGGWASDSEFDVAFQTFVTQATLSVADAQVGEGNSGTTPLVVPVTLSVAVGADVTAAYTLSNGTATGGPACTAGVDFVNTGGVVTIPATSTSGTITVPVCSEIGVELDETLTVTLGAPANAVLGTSQATGTIQNDDSTDLSINDVSANEGAAGTTTFSFTVALSSPAGPGGVTFDIATADGSATVADADYAARGLTGQTIGAGASTYTFDVLVNGDTTFEPSETFFVNVTNVTGLAVSVVDGQGLGTITNDDAPATPTPTATATATPTGTLLPTLTPTPSPAPSVTPTVTPTPAATSTPSPTSTPGPTSTPSPTSTPGPTTTPLPPAVPENEDDSPRPKTEEQRQQEQRTNRSNRDDVYTEGGVIDVGRDEQGAYVVIANRDGNVVVRLLCGDRCPTIRVGDYIQVDGVKENEQLFYADEVSISTR